jgi:DivIVA domain-containing protein
VSLFLLLVALALVGVVAAVAVGRVRGGLDEPASSRPYRPLPEGPLGPSDVDAVRFSLGLRGYRMDEVDAVLGRLRDALADRDAELAGLRRRVAELASEAPASDQDGTAR